MEEKEQRINNLNPLTWAYIGDAVYELYIRERLIETTNLKPHKLHIEAVKKVKAGAQAEFLQRIEEKLNDEEKEIVRRTRNTKNHHLPKSYRKTKKVKRNTELYYKRRRITHEE